MSVSSPGLRSKLRASMPTAGSGVGVSEGGHRGTRGGPDRNGAGGIKVSKGPDLRIFVKDVSDRQGRKRPLTVKSWSTVKDVKDVLRQYLQVPPSNQRLFYGPLMTSGGELPNHRTLNDAGIYRSGEILLLDVRSTSSSGARASASALASISRLNSRGANDVCVSSSLLDVTPRQLRRTVCQARRGFSVNLKPELVLDGSGGTYYLHDARKVRVAVFKPADEEPYAANNPRGYIAAHPNAVEDGMRDGIAPGEACVREVAAYLLDHGGFSGVPATTLAEARHPAFNSNGTRLKLTEGGASIGPHSLTLGSRSPPSPAGGGLAPKKVGSFQEFAHSDYTMDDLSPSKLSVDEVQKIAILDIRLMNADRNSANLLCRRRPEDPDNFELIPIDHGYCLRSVCDVSWFDWCWLDWPQLKEPLSQRSRDYVLGLDVDADVCMLRERLNLPSEAIDYFRASSRLLQAGVRAGLTLYEIAVVCCRNDDAGEVFSKLEVLTSMATELSTSAIANGRWHHSAASRALADQLASPPSSYSGDGVTAPMLSPFRKPDAPRLSEDGRIIKSASSANFSSYAGGSDQLPPYPSSKDEIRSPPGLEHGHSDHNDNDHDRDSPGIVQSSGSDSSSDAHDTDVFEAERDDEERDEWAAAIVADVNVSVDQEAFLRFGKHRSASELSDASSKESAHSGSQALSKSPVGFWTVRPGSEDDEDDDDDDQSAHSVTWSPHLSPHMSPLGSRVGLSGMGSLPKGVDLKNLIPPLSLLEAERRPSTVKFEMSPIKFSSPALSADIGADLEFPSSPLADLSLDRPSSSKLDKVGSPQGFFSLKKAKDIGSLMVRSQSYSAFSSWKDADRGSGHNQSFQTSVRVGEEEDQNHAYFLKFIDLLIERVTTAAARQREVDGFKPDSKALKKNTPTGAAKAVDASTQPGTQKSPLLAVVVESV